MIYKESTKIKPLLFFETFLNNELVKQFTKRTDLTDKEIEQLVTIKGLNIEAVANAEKIAQKQNGVKSARMKMKLSTRMKQIQTEKAPPIQTVTNM